MRFVLLLSLAGFGQALQAQPGSGTPGDDSLTWRSVTINWGPHFHDPNYYLSSTHDLPTEPDRWMLIGDYPFWMSEGEIMEVMDNESLDSEIPAPEYLNAPAGEIVPAAWTNDGAVFLMDTIGFERTGTRVRTWIWYATPKGETPDGFDRSITLSEFDCTRRTTRDLEDRTYRQGVFLGGHGHEWFGPAERWMLC